MTNTTHTRHCLTNADSSVTEELHLQGLWEDTTPMADGVNLWIPAWGMTVCDVVAMWLSDGTVTCRCDD